MGCDGGTIPKRDELVKTKKKKETLSKDIQNAAKWNHCHLSQETLQKPIVADQFGYIYNKEKLIEYILDRSKYEGGPDYIKGLKDVKELDLTINPGYVEEAGKQQKDDNFMFICPITGLQMNGVYKFLFLFSCGCVFSERAFNTLRKSSSDSESTSKCIKCEKSFNKKTDLFVLNPNEKDDLELNKEKFALRKQNAKSKSSSSSASSSTTDTASSSSKRKLEDDTSKKSSSSDRKKDTADKKLKSNGASTSMGINELKNDKTSIQNDPNTSDVYKSLFTSHEKAKNQTKAHWVTFNPQYF